MKASRGLADTLDLIYPEIMSYTEGWGNHRRYRKTRAATSLMNLDVTEAEISELLRKAINLKLRNSLRDRYYVDYTKYTVSSIYITKDNFFICHSREIDLGLA